MPTTKQKQTTQHCNVAIVGGGIAGLLLAYRYLHETDKSIVIIEPNTSRPDHMFGFFDDGRKSLSLASLNAIKTFEQWCVQDSSQKIIHTAKAHEYKLIQAKAYEEFLKAELTNDARVSFTNNKALQHQESTAKTTLTLEDGSQCIADLCFDTRPCVRSEAHLIQHFHGCYIKTQEPVFDTQALQLMDFTVTQNKGMHFMYLLPLTPTTALLESTVYSTNTYVKSWYQAQIDKFMATSFAGMEYEITQTETGAIPLTYQAPQDSFGIAVGLRAGAMRTSSGYAFSQIHDQIFAINLKKPHMVQSPHSKLERRMDDLLLRVLKRHPDRAPAIFTKMAQALSADEFACFMLGHSSFAIKFKLIKALPKMPFLIQSCFGKRLTQ